MRNSMSNHDYLPAEMCPPEFPTFVGMSSGWKFSRPPVGVWFVVVARGIVGGGWGSDWSDDGIPVVSGQRVRLVERGTVYRASEWEVE
jgi:hypothetical protein